MKWSFALILMLSGCGQVEKVAFEAAEEPLSHADHIAPILELRCAGCHRPGSIQSNLMDYEQVILRARAIRERVFVKRDMPLQNKTQMTDEERRIVALWIDQGAPK